MPDIWINAFTMIRSKLTDEEYIAIGKLVHQALKDQWNLNNSKDASKDVELGYTEITVGTS
jgi:hypothetical protein